MTTEDGDKILQCMGLKQTADKSTGRQEIKCNNRWNHTANMRERKVNWAWLQE